MAAVALRLSMLLQVLRAGTNRSLGYRGVLLCCRALRNLQTGLKNIQFPDYDRLIRNTPWN